MEAPAPLRPFFASIFDAALPDLDFKFSFYNIRFPKLAASRGERSLYEKHQTQKERPLLVAWQRPLLRTAEHSGPSSCESRITPPARSHCDGGHKICDWYLTTGAKARAPKFGHWGGSRFSVVPQRWPIAAPFMPSRHVKRHNANAELRRVNSKTSCSVTVKFCDRLWKFGA